MEHELTLPAAAAADKAAGPARAIKLNPAALTIAIVRALFDAEYRLLCAITFFKAFPSSFNAASGTLSIRHSTVNQTEPVCVLNTPPVSRWLVPKTKHELLRGICT